MQSETRSPSDPLLLDTIVEPSQSSVAPPVQIRVLPFGLDSAPCLAICSDNAALGQTHDRSLQTV